LINFPHGVESPHIPPPVVSKVGIIDIKASSGHLDISLNQLMSAVNPLKASPIVPTALLLIHAPFFKITLSSVGLFFPSPINFFASFIKTSFTITITSLACSSVIEPTKIVAFFSIIHFAAFFAKVVVAPICLPLQHKIFLDSSLIISICQSSYSIGLIMGWGYLKYSKKFLGYDPPHYPPPYERRGCSG